MTREQAKREIDSLDYYLQNHTDDYGEESHTAMMMAIKALEQDPICPSAGIDCEDCPAYDPCGDVKAGHWIPVSERLPVEGGEYLITWTGVMDGFEKRSKPIISVTEYEIYEPDNYADWITNVSNDFEHYHDIKVTAWMPLPKPYESQESEEQE